MANEQVSTGNKGKGGPGTVGLEKARQTRAKTAAIMSNATPQEKYALSVIVNAGKAVKLAADLIRSGKSVDSKVTQACATLSAEFAGMGNGQG